MEEKKKRVRKPKPRTTPITDKGPGCRLCGRLRTILEIRELLKVPPDVDVLTVVRSIAAERAERESVHSHLADICELVQIQASAG